MWWTRRQSVGHNQRGFKRQNENVYVWWSTGTRDIDYDRQCMYMGHCGCF